ncbi:hypothetical protein ACHAXH_007453 [Discostella pseudostelligera]
MHSTTSSPKLCPGTCFVSKKIPHNRRVFATVTSRQNLNPFRPSVAANLHHRQPSEHPNLTMKAAGNERDSTSMDRDASNDTNERDEQRFLRIFSRQLAEALRSKDEEEIKERERLRAAAAATSATGSRRSSSRDDETTHWERLRSTYVELCHDDPIISGGDEVCRLLAKALIPKHNKSTKISGNAESNANTTIILSLSSRLVSGILQASSRAVERSRTFTSAQSSNDAAEPMFGSSKITTSEGYAHIAFAIFVEGPYRCIQQAEKHDTVVKFLGSFHPPEISSATPGKLDADEKSRLLEEATAEIVKGMEKVEVESNAGEVLTSSSNVHDDDSSSSSDFFVPNSTNDAMRPSDNDNDSMNEIFAEDSDPDDFDYGTDDDTCISAPTGQTIIGGKLRSAMSDEYDDFHDMIFDPIQLSEPSQANQTCEGTRKSIHYLLSSLSYGKLAFGSLSSRAWSEWGMSETLADLSFMMLLEITNREHHGDAAKSSSFFHQILNDGDESTDIAALWDRPLFALRDRALDKNHGHDALPSYLQLLTALLSHSEHETMLSPQTVQPSPRHCLPPTVIVGLTSLGSMCSSKEMVNTASGRMCGTSVWSVCPREEMKKAIMTSLHYLARIVEGACQRKSVFAHCRSANLGGDESTQGNSPWIRIVVCIIPMIEYLTNLQGRFDFQPVFEGVGSRNATLSESDAQALYESGLFREILSMYTTTRCENGTLNAETPNAQEVARLQLLRTIFTLSIQSPEVLGQYALRVPEFANEVHSSSFLDNHLVDAILWLSIGSYLLENKSGQSNQPRLKPRTGSSISAAAPPKETKSLAERSLLGFVAMCGTTKMTLEYLKQCVQCSEGGTLSDEQKEECDARQGELDNIKTFSNFLSNCPSMTNIWLGSLKNNDDATSVAREHLAQLKSTLASLPSFSDEVAKTHHLGHKKDDDSDCIQKEGDGLQTSDDEANRKEQTMKQFRKEYRTVVGFVWSSVKVISLALDSQKGSALSKTD